MKIRYPIRLFDRKLITNIDSNGSNYNLKLSGHGLLPKFIYFAIIVCRCFSPFSFYFYLYLNLYLLEMLRLLVSVVPVI